MTTRLEKKKKGLFLDQKKAVEETEAISQKYNLHVDAQKRVREHFQSE